MTNDTQTDKYTRKEIIGNCTLYCGDCMDIMPELGECADLVCTDPPYKLTGGGKSDSMGGVFAGENYNNNGKIVECNVEWSDFMPLLYDCLIGDSHAYIMANNRHVQNMLNEAEKAGFRFHNLLVWDKGSATPNRWYMKNLEFIGLFFKGKAKFINDCGSKQLIKVPQENYGTHPTTKPVELMKHYILNSSNEKDTVIDPFMGTCPVGAACFITNRKFIGIEKDPEYFDIACKRIEEASRQKDLFI